MLLVQDVSSRLSLSASSSALTSSTTSGGITVRATRKPPASSIAFLISTAQRCSKSRIRPDVPGGSVFGDLHQVFRREEAHPFPSTRL